MAHVQFAMLYTTQYGERRIRVFNHSIPVAKNMSAYFKSADVEATSQFVVRKELSKVALRGVKAVKEALLNNMVTLLY